ncbi:HAD family hydrolase [Thermococcus sp.]
MKAVLFDIDGTLLTEEPLIMLFLPWIYDDLSKKLGVNKEEARNRFMKEIIDRRGTYEWHDWNFFFHLFNINLQYENLLREYPHKIHVYPDVHSTLKWLKQEGYKLGVITSGPKYQKLKLRIAKLDRYFDIIVTRDDVNAIKPEPKIFLYVIEQLGIEPKDAMMIGDSLQQDVYGAKNIGMTGVWINRKNEKGYNFADFEIKTLHELRKILEVLR